MILRFLAVMAVAVTLAACAAMTGQKALPPVTDDSEFKNLRVLPHNIEHDALIEMMRGYATALGQRCEFCHVRTQTTPTEVFDFASDENHHKDVARQMILLTRRINRDLDRELKKDAGEVTCMTCHRGKKEPEVEEMPDLTTGAP